MIVATAIFVSTPALADLNVNGEVTDTYKQIINKTPYSVEVCTDVNVPGDKTSDMLTGAIIGGIIGNNVCLLYTSPSPRDQRGSRMPASA